MLPKNSNVSFIHLIHFLNTYYVPGNVQSAETCVSKKRGRQERARPSAAIKRWVSGGVGAGVGKMSRKVDFIKYS